MSSQRGALQGGMCSRTSVCRPRVHLIETTLRSMKDVATTSMGEGVMRIVILRYLRRPRSTPTGPSRMAPERQAACGMAWMVHNERRRLVARNHDKTCAFGGSADEVLFGWPKKLDAQSAMADVSLAAMAGVTAADHERISKSYLVKSRVWA